MVIPRGTPARYCAHVQVDEPARVWLLDKLWTLVCDGCHQRLLDQLPVLVCDPVPLADAMYFEPRHARDPSPAAYARRPLQDLYRRRRRPG